MRPESRQQEYLYQIPPFSLESERVEGFMDQLREFHGEFAECFFRRETRENVFDYLVGRLSQLQRKTIEPIAVHVNGKGAVRSMQRALSKNKWDDALALSVYHELVAKNLGADDGVLIFDEAGFVKKGGHSAGVSRQYCGNVGKVENCQVGVFAGYASRHGYSLLDKRLYLPRRWFDESHAEKRDKCEIPDELEFATKPQLAAQMLLELHERQHIPFCYILADTVYGNNADFIEAAEQCTGTTYLVSMSSDTSCWLQWPPTETQTYRHRSKLTSKQVLKEPAASPITFEQFATGLHEHFWYARTVCEGTKGPIECEFARRQVVLAKNGLPYKRVWLIIKRTCAEEPKYTYYVSNASATLRLRTFVWLSGVRWAIEQCFEEANQEVGMSHYEVRKFAGWHHHIFTCMLAHFFLWWLKLSLGKKKRQPSPFRR